MASRELVKLFNKNQKYLLLQVLLMIIVVSILEAAGVGLMLPLISILIVPEKLAHIPVLRSLVPAQGTNSAFLIYCGLAIFTSGYFIKNIIVGFCIKRQSTIVYSLHRSLANSLLSSYLYAPYHFHLKKNSAELLGHIQTEIPSMVNGVLVPSIQIFSDFIIMLSILTLLLVIQPALTAYAVLSFSLILFLAYRVVRKKLVRCGETRLKSMRMMYVTASKALSGIKDIKVLNMQPALLADYDEHVCRLTNSASTILLFTQLPRLLVEFIIILGFSSILIYSMLFLGGIKAALPLIATYAMASFRLMPSLNRILNSGINRQYYMSSIKVLVSAFKETQSAIETSENVPAVIFNKKIEFKDIRFGYPEAKHDVLKGVNLIIHKGQSTALVGPSGAGKTTFVDIMLGLLENYRGHIFIDNEPLNKSNMSAWQRQIGYVPQDVYIADESVARNIAFGERESHIDNDRLMEVIRMAQLSEVIAGLPQGVQTTLGERGIKLSGGQKQRIGIARALYRQPTVLVLDEATSALDGLTEKEVTQQIDALRGDMTIVIIAHRLSTIKKCDAICVLEEGRLAASGDYETLQAQSDYFSAVTTAV